MDHIEGIVVRDYDSGVQPQTVVQLFKGLLKVYMNQTNVLEGSMAVVEHNDKDHVAALEKQSLLFFADIKPTRHTERA